MSESELSEESVIELLKCSICKELVPRSEVRKHTANHFSKTEHICEHCGKCFAQNFNLVNHMRIHTGELTQSDPAIIFSSYILKYYF